MFTGNVMPTTYNINTAQYVELILPVRAYVYTVFAMKLIVIRVSYRGGGETVIPLPPPPQGSVFPPQEFEKILLLYIEKSVQIVNDDKI